MKQTTEGEAMPNYFVVTFVVILLACVVCPLEGRVCTRVRAETRVKTVQYPGECHTSFEANCGWFSFDKCNHTEVVPCIKTRNISATIYRVVEECCPGYHRNKDRRCVPGKGPGGGQKEQQQPEKHAEGFPGSGVKESVTSGSRYFVEDGSEHRNGQSNSGGSSSNDEGLFLGLSHGAYAGIICGILFVSCVALLTAVHYRKRRLQDEKKVTVPADQEAAQRQQMIPLEKIDSQKIDSPPAVAT